jgi:glucose-1-phosphate thymidylyltransferase
MIKNGILLAGGTGTRLMPLTHTIQKHLIPVGGHFIIDYPIHTLQQMGVENLTVILGGDHFSQVVDHCQDGKRWKMDISYKYQGSAKGIAQAINLCQKQMANAERFAVILGDNIFEQPVIWDETLPANYAQIALYPHPELHRFGVASIITETGKITQIEEKPKELNSQYQQRAIVGAYLFDQRYWEFFSNIQPSARGEWEITDIIRQYLDAGDLHYTEISGLWSDAGTHDSIAFLNDYFYRKG